MNTIALITTVSFFILIVAVIGDFIVNKPKNKLGAFFSYAIALSSTFIGITLGLYFTDLDNENQERQDTMKSLEIALNDIEVVQEMILKDYLKEAANYYDENAAGREDSHPENMADFEIPFPVTIENIMKSFIHTKHIPKRLFYTLNYCFHNAHNLKRYIEARKGGPANPQLLEGLKNYITLLSYNYFIINTELKYLNGELSDAETQQYCDQGFEKTRQVLQSGKWDEFLNRQLVRDTLNIELR